MNKLFFIAALVVLACAEPPAPGGYNSPPSSGYGAPAGNRGGASAQSGSFGPLMEQPLGANEDTMEGVAPGPIVDQAILDKVVEALTKADAMSGGSRGAGGYQQGGGQQQGGYPQQGYGAPQQGYGAPQQSSGGYDQGGAGGEKIELGDITQGRLVANFVQRGEAAGGYQGGNQGGSQGGYQQGGSQGGYN